MLSYAGTSINEVVDFVLVSKVQATFSSKSLGLQQPTNIHYSTLVELEAGDLQTSWHPSSACHHVACMSLM